MILFGQRKRSVKDVVQKKAQRSTDCTTERWMPCLRYSAPPKELS